MRFDRMALLMVATGGYFNCVCGQLCLPWCVCVCVRAPVFPFTTHHSFTTIPRSGPSSSMKSCDVYGTLAIYISDRAYQDYPTDTVKTTVLCLSEKVKTWPCRSVCAVRTRRLRREPADEQLCTEACIIWVYGRSSGWTTVYGSRLCFQLVKCGKLFKSQPFVILLYKNRRKNTSTSAYDQGICG